MSRTEFPRSTKPPSPLITDHSPLLRTGVRLHYCSAGPSLSESRDGKVILFIHGWPDTWYGWNKQMTTIAACGWRVLAMDCRGYGHTVLEDKNKFSDPKDLKHYTWKEINADIAALLAYEGIEKIIIVCHDWGGAVGWHMARRYPWRVHGIAAVCTPYRPRKRTFIDTKGMAEIMPIYFYQHYFNEYQSTAAAELESDPSFTLRCIYRSSRADDQCGHWISEKSHKNGATFLSGFRSRPQPISLSPILSEKDLEEYTKSFRQSGFYCCLNYYRTGKLNWEEEYSPADDEKPPQEWQGKVPTVNIECHALMVTAGKDKVIKPQLSMGMEAWVPKLQRAHIENAAHWVMHEQPDALNDILIKWIASLPRVEDNIRAAIQRGGGNTQSIKAAL